MPRSVWSGALSFGLVSIPVSLYPATDPKDVRFHLFDREGRRVRYRRVVEAGGPAVAEPRGEDVADELDHERAAVDDERTPSQAQTEEVAYEDLVRGHEIDADTFVFLTAEEIERARPGPSRAIDLEHFVRLEEIDPVYFEKAYHAVPARGAEKPYLLLLRSLQDTGRVGIGRFVLRTKPHLVALRPMGDVLALETLYFGDEVRDPRHLVGGLDAVAVTERELDVAKQLIEALATDWEPANYADEYREELLRLIAERTPERVEEQPTPAPGGRVEQLLDALRRSVEDAKTRRDPKAQRGTG
jgi:DNA end-binding protein Ku